MKTNVCTSWIINKASQVNDDPSPHKDFAYAVLFASFLPQQTPIHPALHLLKLFPTPPGQSCFMCTLDPILCSIHYIYIPLLFLNIFFKLW